MNKKTFFALVVLTGLSLAIYGLLKAPLINEAEIRTTYKCDRSTREALITDKYCSNPSSAPIAHKQLANGYVFSGVAVAVAGCSYFLTNRK